MAIVLIRVDERLIHGQVVVGWGEYTRMDHIVVIDDEISASPWEQELYGLGVPPGVDATFATVEEARSGVATWRGDAGRTALLLRDCGSLERLATGGVLSGLDVNLGGIHFAPGRVRVLPYLFLSDTDCDCLQRVSEAGVTVAARDLPATRPVSLASLISACP